MAMRAYLCVTDRETLYPNADQMEVVSEATHHLPFLWLALFRPRDLQPSKREALDEQSTLDPITSRETALRQLEKAVPTFERMFSELGPIEGYCDWLYRAVAGRQQRYVFIDSVEIGLDDESYHHSLLQYATGVFEQRVPLAVERKSLLQLSSYDDTMPFPSLHLPRAAPRDLWMAQSKIIGGLETPPPIIRL